MDDSFSCISRRSAVLGINGCVASSNPTASQIGLDILKAGGNAADAAVAVAAALNVTEPMSTGLGGDAFCLFYDNSTKTVKGLNGSGRSASATSLSVLESQGFSRANPFSPLHGHSVTVPGAAAAWVDTVELFGSKKLSMSDILKPSIELAETGFPMHEIASVFWAKASGKLQRPENVYGGELLLNGEPPKMGAIMRNPTLARTLKDIAANGKEAFYSGRIAKAITAAIQHHGGLMTMEDLAAHRSTQDDPISVDYKGLRVWEMPPNGQGLATLIALNILEGFDLKEMGHNSAEYLHHVIESLRLAFSDVFEYCADPAVESLPLSQLLSKDYAAKRRALISPEKAITTSTLYGGGLDLPQGGDTVYFTTADKWGNACSFINSNFQDFGTGIVPEGCGFTLQNRGCGFTLRPGHKNVYAPNKRPYHTIIPSMVTTANSNELLMSYGVMGGFMQPQGHVQVLLNMAEFQCDPQRALDLPRICLGGGVGTAYSKDEVLDKILVEEGIPLEVLLELSRLKHWPHAINGWERSVFGRGQVISAGDWWRTGWQDVKSKVYWTGSDLRADGMVAAY